MLVTFRNDISFDFKYFLAFAPLVSNNSFVFRYFLASFRLPSCVFNHIVASFVLFLYFPPIPACPFRRHRSALPFASGHRTLLLRRIVPIDHQNRLSHAERFVK